MFETENEFRAGLTGQETKQEGTGVKEPEDEWESAADGRRKFCDRICALTLECALP